QVCKGLDGPISVVDPNEAALIASGVIPPASQTLMLALSDITVCKDPGSNDAVTYDPSLPWVGGGALPAQQGPHPVDLCETIPLDEDGNSRGPFAAGDVPNIQKNINGATNEGQTVITNGKNVGARPDIGPAIHSTATGGITLWTEDFRRTGPGFANLPTVPVMHLNVIGTAPSVYTIADGTALRASLGAGALVEAIGPATGTLL